jgi:hypothetical protein
MWKSADSISGPESQDYGHKDPSRWPRGTLYMQKSVLASPTSGGRSFGIVRSRTQATEFGYFLVESIYYFNNLIKYELASRTVTLNLFQET